jgi:hypothetical protein
MNALDGPESDQLARDHLEDLHLEDLHLEDLHREDLQLRPIAEQMAEHALPDAPETETS